MNICSYIIKSSRACQAISNKFPKRRGGIIKAKDIWLITDSFFGTFRRNLLRANHLKKWGAKLPAYFRFGGKGSGVARVSWRGKPVSLTGDGFFIFYMPIIKFRGHFLDCKYANLI
jgi:hypothetical protein